MRWKMLDRIEYLGEGNGIGYKAVTSCEDYFEHHMPLFEIVPGTLLVESMSELGGRLAIYTLEKKGGRPCWAATARIQAAEFHEFVRPGSLLRLSAELIEVDERAALAECEARIDDRLYASATVAYLITPFELDQPYGPLGLEYMRGSFRALWDGYDL